MTGEKNNARTALFSAFVLVPVAALTIVLTSVLLSRTGLPFAAAYAVSILAAVIGTCAASYGGKTLITLPSPAIISWLVYEEIIARGITWQEMLGIAALVSLLGAVLTRTRYAAALQRALPATVRTGLVLGLSLTLLMTAALHARILLPSPWVLTMGGTLSDPLTYFTLTGILLVLVLWARKLRFALPLGMALIALLTWAEGFWEIPAAPFLAPDLISLSLVLTLPQSDFLLSLPLGMTLLLALVIESEAVLAAQTDAAKGTRSLARLFTVSGFAALIGAFPLTIAPISAALPTEKETHGSAGIPRTALLSALLLLALLPCAPLLAALADFPAVPAIALASIGLMLLVRGLAMLKCTEDITLREGAVVAAFVLASYDIKTGLTLALFLWTLLTAARGERVPRMTGALTVLFSVFFLLKWIL